MDKEAIGSEWVGRLIDEKYPLLQWLGGSESGHVFLTERKKTSRQRLAIKLLPAGDPNAEARIAGWTTATTLSHPHLMPLFDCGRCRAGDTSLIYSVSLYSEELLSQILAERPLAPAEAEEMLKPVIDALSYLHGNGFVHGHLKPSNLMVVGDSLRLSSDRLEAVGSSGAHHKPTNVYDAPERDRKAISPAADVWSLGVTLIEALIQRTPGWKPSMTRAPIVPKAVPEPYAGIAKECLRRSPSNRCTLSDIQARLFPDAPLQIKPAADEAPEPAAGVTAEPVAEATTESIAEPAAEAVVQAAAEPAAETPPEPVLEAGTEPAAEATVETLAEAATEPVAESVTESAAEVKTESAPQAQTEPAEESVPEPASEAIKESATEAPSEAVVESATESATEPATQSVEEVATESLPEFVPEPVKLPEPEPPRFRLNSTNTILLGFLGVIALLALLFNLHQPASPSPTPARNEPRSSAPSSQAADAPTANPGTTPGQVVHQVLPDVPSSDSAKISSTIEVKVLVTVDANGKIEDTILNVPGPSPSLAALALKAAQKWSFKPAFVQGRPTSSFWILEFQFGRGSTKAIPFEVSP